MLFGQLMLLMASIVFCVGSLFTSKVGTPPSGRLFFIYTGWKVIAFHGGSAFKTNMCPLQHFAPETGGQEKEIDRSANTFFVSPHKMPDVLTMHHYLIQRKSSSVATSVFLRLDP